MTRKLILTVMLNIWIFLQVSTVTSFVSAVSLPRPHSMKPASLPHKRFSVVASNTENNYIASHTDAAPVSGGSASLSASTFNLAKSIIGAGVLSLPSGVAFFADEPSALMPASVICAVFGLIAAYSFSSIGKVCRDTKSKSFQEVWEKTVSPKTAWTISGSITAMCFLASLAYSIFIGDSFTSLAQTFGLGDLATRSNVIIALTASVLLPLCSLKSLSVLSPFSLLGLGGTLYTAVFMAIRFFDKSYFAGGKFFELIAAKPSFNARGGYTLNYLTLVLLSMLSTSYIAHYNAPQFYNELTNNTMARFNTLVGGAFGAAIVFFIFIMSIGFLTFGGATSGFILNNYASQDQLATLARFAIGLALLTGYPFTFSALREGLLDIMGKKDEAERKKYFTPLTWSLLAGVTALALVLKDVGFVVSITGALFGCFLMFIVPAVMNLSNKVSPLGGIEKLGNLGMIGTGVVMGVLGVYVSVARQLGKL